MLSVRDKSLPTPDGLSDFGIKFSIIGWTIHFLSILLVILRFLSRRATRSIGSEDWVCLAALVFAIGFSVSFTLQLTIGRAGYHETQLSQKERATYNQLTVSSNVMHNCTITLAKVSVLLFLKRVFAIHRSFERFIYIMNPIVIADGLTTTGIMVFSCIPVQAQWKPWLPKKCIAFKPFLVSVATINMLLDIVVLVSPQPLVWRLQMSKKRKILLSSLFMVGGMVCVMSIIRLRALVIMDEDDMSYSATIAHLWSLIELNQSIYCICMPMIPSLIRHWRGSSLSGGSRPSGPSDVYSHTLGRNSGRQPPGSTTCLQGSTDELYTNIELVDRRSEPEEAKGLSVRMQTDIEMHWETTSSRTRAGSV